jgi:drug/metabolite transporter (DMT)-like permease
MYNIGIALQALEARETDPAGGLRPSLIARLLMRRRWLAGTALNILGWPLQAVALLLAPVAVVQPGLAFGLLALLAIGAHRLHERIRVPQVIGTLVLLAGVTALGLLAPQRSTGHAAPLAMALVLGALGGAALVPYALRHGGRITGVGAALSAGLALAWSGLSTKFVADALHRGDVAGIIIWMAATGLASGVGLLSEMTALQRAPATQVAPLVFVVQVLIPVALAPVLTGERWTHGLLGDVGTLAALAAVVGGAVALLRSDALPAAVSAASVETETAAKP